MSEPGGSFKLRVGDEGTQTMVEGKVDLGSYVNEEISSSSFEDIPSRVDSAGVIKWLRSVGEARANSFWKRYSFPPRLYRGRMRGDELYVLVKGSHKRRVKVPLPPLVH